MPEDEALKAITINPAKIIGVDDRVGSLEEGKDTDMLILRGTPFKTRSIPEAVLINGKLVYKMERGARLKQLLLKNRYRLQLLIAVLKSGCGICVYMFVNT
jgi:cytosine/adenosine deaminase-related metal-dependent hydrolase